MLSTLFVLPSLVSNANNDLSIAVKRVQNGEARCRTITTIDEKTISEEVYPKVHRIKCTLALENSGFSPSLESFRMPCHFVFIYISPCRFFILMITMFLTTFKQKSDSFKGETVFEADHKRSRKFSRDFGEHPQLPPVHEEVSDLTSRYYFQLVMVEKCYAHQCNNLKLATEKVAL